jgi:hypothetical protein
VTRFALRHATGLAFALGLALGCGSNAPQRPADAPPTPKSVTMAAPGGDAPDPHHAALLRQLTQPWGERNDKDDQLHAGTPDWENWKRVRFWGVDHFTGWRYGDDHHVVGIVFLIDTPDGKSETSESCTLKFETMARPIARRYDVKLGEIQTRETRWRRKPLVVRTVDGSVIWGFSEIHFSAAWASYAAYPDACATYAMAVRWDEDEELAKAVRERWANEGFQHFRPFTKKRPHRLPD